MPFTDEQIAKLEKELEGEFPILPEWPEEIRALLARLEAAEKALEASEYQEENRYFYAWLAASGKEPKV